MVRNDLKVQEVREANENEKCVKSNSGMMGHIIPKK